MADRLTPERRSRLMSQVASKNTKPELEVRSLLHRLGYRFRLHPKDVPGKPDIIFRSRKMVIFVNGCFWHGHNGCRFGRLPKSKLDFWGPKIERNRERDFATNNALVASGWKVHIVWQCELKEPNILVEKLQAFLGPTRSKIS